MKVKAKKINNPDCDYLTEGKVYEAILDDEFKGWFWIVCDTGEHILLRFKDSKDIHGDWTIITEPARAR